eukprot:TRINITY_DN1288_c0_g1_i3.p1 TRINITY_DN1288_c0_g1~~TRINITY_DN1288_c0_g1_i3.p1  ORF type:complete len:110 (+),score=12.94 TRINITY_DN1288_c0_g1_i3:217-546(+)
MATEGEAYAISKALGDINLERIRGPGDEKFVSLGSLWKEQTAVIYVLRRFGCRLCRANAAELSKTVLPILEENKIRVVAVGTHEGSVGGSCWFKVSEKRCKLIELSCAN